MQGGHAVDGVAGADAQVGHTHLAVPDDGHVGHLAHVAAEVLLQLALVTGGDLLEDLPDPGQQGSRSGSGGQRSRASASTVWLV